LTDSAQYFVTWPTTVGACCVIVGGLSLFGGCLSLTGMAEIEQLHTAIPFGDGKISEELLKKLDASAPPRWISSIASALITVLSLFLIHAGVGLLKRVPSARKSLLVWSMLYIFSTFAAAIINWIPRMPLVREYAEVQGMFLAQIMISLPLYLVLPVFLLIYLNKKQVRNEVALWR